MIFRDDYGVYVCSHVFKNTRPILESVRDEDGSWQFLCGVEGCLDEGGPHLVGVGHLIARDPSINELIVLNLGMYAERASDTSKWEFGTLDN